MVVNTVLGYIYLHNEGIKPILICKHCHDYCNFKSLHGLFLLFLYATTEIDKTNVFLYSSQSSISTQR